ncbi:hypothetical protein L1887_02140 [Cichorium endivia]|nr:hypothetical protein L1887_02140 [Cichorium endivia]
MVIIQYDDLEKGQTCLYSQRLFGEVLGFGSTLLADPPHEAPIQWGFGNIDVKDVNFIFFPLFELNFATIFRSLPSLPFISQRLPKKALAFAFISRVLPVVLAADAVGTNHRRLPRRDQASKNYHGGAIFRVQFTQGVFKKI